MNQKNLEDEMDSGFIRGFRVQGSMIDIKETGFTGLGFRV